jgi:hypothetical protein
VWNSTVIYNSGIIHSNFTKCQSEWLRDITHETFFFRSNIRVVGLNPTRVISVCFFPPICVVLRRQRPCDRADYPSKESYQLSVRFNFKINSEWEEARRLNPSRQEKKKFTVSLSSYFCSCLCNAEQLGERIWKEVVVA